MEKSVLPWRWQCRWTVVLVAVVASIGVGTSSRVLAASEAEDTLPTFSRDIAPILQRSCQQCHQPSGIGPMSLLTYSEVRPLSLIHI